MIDRTAKFTCGQIVKCFCIDSGLILGVVVGVHEPDSLDRWYVRSYAIQSDINCGENGCDCPNGKHVYTMFEDQIEAANAPDVLALLGWASAPAGARTYPTGRDDFFNQWAPVEGDPSHVPTHDAPETHQDAPGRA